MAKFYQDIIANGGTIRTHELHEPRAYYGLTTQIPDEFYIAIEKHRKVVVPKISGIVLCYWEKKYCTMGVEILRNYLTRKDRNISRLMDYARQMRVQSTMGQYLEMGL